MSFIELKKSISPIDYLASSLEMEELADKIAKNEAPERIWFLEHPNIYTCGRSYKEKDILVSNSTPIVKTARGGRVTFHGEGQRIVWLMLRIHNHAPHIRAFIDLIQKWIMKSLLYLGIKTDIHPKHIGIWVRHDKHNQNKIVAIGLRVRKGISRYGFAINVTTNLNFYKNIIPCGITEDGLGVTSIAKEWQNNSKISKNKLLHPPDIMAVDKVLINSFESVFSVPLEEVSK